MSNFIKKNPLSGSRVVLCGRTDRNDEANSRFWQFCELAKNEYVWNTEITVLLEDTPMCLNGMLSMFK